MKVNGKCVIHLITNNPALDWQFYWTMDKIVLWSDSSVFECKYSAPLLRRIVKLLSRPSRFVRVPLHDLFQNFN